MILLAVQMTFFGVDEVELSTAWQNHQWTVFAALLITGVVGISKLPIAGAFFQKIPTSIQPLVPFGLGFLSGVAKVLLAHEPWPVALLMGFFSGMAAIGAQQVFSKSFTPIAKSTASMVKKMSTRSGK